MDATLSPLFEGFLHLPDAALYALLFGAALLENVLPPLPGDAAVMFGGYLAGTGRLALPWTFAWVTLGSWCGFMSYYAIGRALGRSRAHRWVERWATPEALARGEAWVRRWGYWVVLANRLLAGARSVISLVAGFAELTPTAVALASLASAAAWNVLLVGAGYRVGESWESIAILLGRYQWAVTVLIAVAAALWLGLRLWRARQPQHPR